MNNLIIITLDGARTDFVKKSSLFKTLESKSFFSYDCITYAPHTIAAMHAIFSGTYGSRNGTNSYWSTYQFKKHQFKTLTEYLQNNNFKTIADLHSDILIPKQGFDEFLIHDEHNENIKSKHLSLIENVSKTSEKNFFLYLHYSYIHTKIGETVVKKYTNFSKEYFLNKESNQKAYLSYFDNAESYLSSILEKIIKLGLEKNSIICILSDHGISIGEKIGERAYGAFLFDYTIKSFCYFLFPESKSFEIKQQIRTIDIMPTILEKLNIPLDPNFSKLDGVSLIPLLNGNTLDEKFAFSETGNPLENDKPPKLPNTKSLRTDDWKLIYNTFDDTRELYNLRNDPDELTNLFGDFPEIEKKFQEKMDQLEQGIED
tara:strand:- start:9248 stop:10366 length:1119 start_codon:yes stop_codon:yes gene_type:complete